VLDCDARVDLEKDIWECGEGVGWQRGNGGRAELQRVGGGCYWKEGMRVVGV